MLEHAAAARASVGGMFTSLRRRWQLSRVRPGDGSALPEYRVWQLFSRTVFGLDLGGHRYEVDVRYGADGSTRRSPTALYRDGVQVARAGLPATFEVPGGVIEVAANQFGVRRMHHVPDGGSARLLAPHPRTPEGRRARFAQRHPQASRALGVVAVVVALGAALVAALRGIEAITRSPEIAARVGTFTLPIPTPWLAVIGLLGALAALERTLTFRSRWLFDRRR